MAIDPSDLSAVALTAGKLVKVDTDGKPADATNTDAEVAAAVTASHARSHDLAGASDHSSTITPGAIIVAAATTGLPTASAHLTENATGVGVGISNTPTELLTLGVESSSATERKTIRLNSGGYAEPAAYNTASNGDKIILFDSATAGYEARIGVGNSSDFWFKSSGPLPTDGKIRFFIGSTPTKILDILNTGLNVIGSVNISSLSAGLVQSSAAGLLSIASAATIEASHTHSKLIASDGSPDPAFSANASGNCTAVGTLTFGEGHACLMSTKGTYSIFIGGGGQSNVGEGNVAIGKISLEDVTDGDDNICLGSQAGKNITTGNRNLYIGSNAIASASDATNEIAIGDDIEGFGSNTIVLGNSSHTKTYLNGIINSNSGRIVKTTIVVADEGVLEAYAVLASDHHIFVDAIDCAITINLPAGVDGTEYYIYGVMETVSNITVVPNGAELLFLFNTGCGIAEYELHIVYKTGYGWIGDGYQSLA